MNLEGGVGADFLNGGLTVGLNYYASFKLTDDEIDGFPTFSFAARTGCSHWARSCSLRWRKGILYGFLKANYQWETYARTTTQGSALTMLATFLVKPLTLPQP